MLVIAVTAFVLYKMLPKGYISNKVRFYRRQANSGIKNVLEKLFRGGMFSLIMVVMFWLSILFYILFYYSFVPSTSYVRPIHLQVHPCENLEKENCSYPYAHIRLTKRQQLLMLGQQYKFNVFMDMPESPVNLNLGMFMVCIRLSDKNGYVTSQSCRSNMLHYQSDFVRSVSLALFSPLYIFGTKEEKQTLAFELYSDYVENQYHPVTDVFIEVKAREIEVYAATFQINAHLTGFRYFMYYWPLSSAVVGIICNLCSLFFITALSLYHRYFIQIVPTRKLRKAFPKGSSSGIIEVSDKDTSSSVKDTDELINKTVIDDDVMRKLREIPVAYKERLDRMSDESKTKLDSKSEENADNVDCCTSEKSTEQLENTLEKTIDSCSEDCNANEMFQLTESQENLINASNKDNADCGCLLEKL